MSHGNCSDDDPEFMKEPPHGAEVGSREHCNFGTICLLEHHCGLVREQVFVGGVPRGATEEQIKEYASRVGPVKL